VPHGREHDSDLQRKEEINTYIYIGLKVPYASKVIQLRVSYTQNNETLRQNSLMYTRKANRPIAVH